MFPYLEKVENLTIISNLAHVIYKYIAHSGNYEFIFCTDVRKLFLLHLQ